MKGGTLNAWIENANNITQDSSIPLESNMKCLLKLHKKTPRLKIQASIYLFRLVDVITAQYYCTDYVR